MDIFSAFQATRVDYARAMDGGIIEITDQPPYDISVIIPVNGRTEFNRPVCRYLKKAIEATGMKISITIVEHSEKPAHKDLCFGWVNYIWIPMHGQPFNKCLAHNIGAIQMQNCAYYLFHDIDIVVPRDFFDKIMMNMVQYDAVQTFTKRRLLHCNLSLTQFILDDVAYVESFFPENKDVTPAKIGAKGGSIFMTKELFVKVGGFDDCFFSEYSIEDAAFFHKMQLLGRVGYCDEPEIELLHLEHEPSYNRVTKQSDLEFYRAINELDIDGRRKLAGLQSEYMQQFITTEEKLPDYIRGVIDATQKIFEVYQLGPENAAALATDCVADKFKGAVIHSVDTNKFIFKKFVNAES